MVRNDMQTATDTDLIQKALEAIDRNTASIAAP